MSRRVTPLFVLLVLALPAPARAVQGTFFLNAFGPGTDLPAQPQPARVFTQAVGEIGVHMSSDPLFGFSFTGGIDTFLQPPEIGRFSLNAASVHYNFGFVRPLLLVSEGAPVDDTLLRMRRARQPMGLVVNDAGEVVGLLTIEDILEEIVGKL